ncbi:GNAT family N-acetyltransferase [Sporosalibacterium faouarense]|uniref:GNAT family N-acetyltransferase n=1 Tax=Sporosalibacterium faouarense TaxID=516123 RepID=UPI00192B1081|nr:GNAT family N-acetyltransferase [Sporosalibacterium faouarense]
MDERQEYIDYYCKYLGINILDLSKGNIIFSCNQRNEPISGSHFQHLIITEIDGKQIFSISPKYYNGFKKHILKYKENKLEGVNKLKPFLQSFFENKLKKHQIRKMYRLTVNKDEMIDIPSSLAIQLTKEILMDNIKDKDRIEKDRIWRRKKTEVEDGRQYTILDDGKITCWCKVSDIDFDGGNLAVWTSPKYRRRGYGKQVTLDAVKWCFRNNVIPIYWVDSTNVASINLAKGIGFKVMSEEIVVSSIMNQY